MLKKILPIVVLGLVLLILAVQMVPGTTLITIPAGIYALTRPQSGANGEDNGDLNLTAPLGPNQSIIITGAGAASTIIDANQIDRVILIDPGRIAMITGVTIRNGYRPAPYPFGGGMHMLGSATVRKSTIDNNGADYGGGILNGDVLYVVNSTLSQNDAYTNGGGIYNQTTTALYNTSIIDNDADHDATHMAALAVVFIPKPVHASSWLTR
jgi:hypothetical protein